GKIVDADGRPLGDHAGIHGFTLGQRKSLGVALGKRAYVVGIDAESAQVRLGEQSELLVGAALLGETSLAPDLAPPFDCDVLVRYRGSEHRARVRAAEQGLYVELTEPVAAVVPG